MVKRALLSVSDKTGIAEFGRSLQAFGVEILSTGGTADALKLAGVKVIEVASVTGFPEIMDGRVKTLHPHIHAGILARRGQDDAILEEHGIGCIDLVVVNLYPFNQTVADPNCTFGRAIENIDIGGPAMIRAAAKNQAWVTVIVDSEDYSQVLRQLEQNSEINEVTRKKLANKAFAHTARYDAAIANYLRQQQTDGEQAEQFADLLSLEFQHRQSLRYGENPQQAAAFYVETITPIGMAAVKQLQGKELSFNNIVDADTAMACVVSFTEPTCVIVKHANPCGVAQGKNLFQAYERAFSTDPTSAFGGIIAFNAELDAETAKAIVDRQFVEVIIAPKVSVGAKEILASKVNIRVLRSEQWPRPYKAHDYKRVTGALLVQETDNQPLDRSQLRVVTQRQPSEREWEDLVFAWQVVKYVKSNAIVYCRDRMTIGIGAGQMSRVYSSRIAVLKAADEGLQMQETAMASDAFFPFRDGLDEAAKAGAKAVIQPGGSKRDDEVIAAANEYGMTMVFTGVRHFRH